MTTENAGGRPVCAGLAAALVLAADNELSTAEWRAVERHLPQCPVCRVQWAAFSYLDRRLLECRTEFNESPPNPAVRARLVSALRNRDHEGWRVRLPRLGKWRWAAASFAGLSLAALIAWTTLVPRNSKPRDLERRDAAPVSAAAAREVIQLKLSLAPIGDPFLDGSPAESLVPVYVAVGSDGQPTGIGLVE